MGSLVSLHPRYSTFLTSQGRTVLETNQEGFISKKRSREGLWVYQTRMLSLYRWLIEGKPPQLSACSNIEPHTWMGYYVQAPPNCKDTPAGECDPLQETIELRLSRSVGEGMHEDVDITNHTQIETSFKLDLEVDCDFGDPGVSHRGESGHLLRKWQQSKNHLWELQYEYEAEHAYEHQGDKGVEKVHRAIKLRLEHSDSEPTYQGRKISFQVKLKPHGIWHACLNWIPKINRHELPLQYGCNAFNREPAEWDTKRNAFLARATQFRNPEGDNLTTLALDVLERSKRDLAALRLYDLDRGQHSWVAAAGLPTYLALFGRDSLTTGWEASLLGTEMIRGALSTLPKYQATETNDWRDAQPGRMVHGVHTDPSAELNYNPHHLYYGGVTDSIFYPLIVADLWHWTGDEELVRPFLQPALKGLAWADNCLRGADGFYRYQTRSQQGEKNQGWKDSGDAIVYPDGSQVEDPLGTCEMQAFVYASKLHFSELLWWTGEKELAEKFYKESQELKKKFNDVFWMEEEGYIAMGIDFKGQTIKSIASDPGQCLMHGIVDDALVPRLAKRMMAKDMFSGWGIRTLSAEHPAYNPFAYHRGTVWPVVNAMFVLGFARYGLHQEMHTLCKAMFEAASIFDHHRLPEVFAGHQRDAAHPFPGMYIKADWPQAWTASAPFKMIQSMLGIVPFAPLETLFVDPWLPEWLPALTLEQLRVGKAEITLEFRRGEQGRTNYKVVEQKGALRVLRQPMPWALTAGSGKQVKQTVMSLLAA